MTVIIPIRKIDEKGNPIPDPEIDEIERELEAVRKGELLDDKIPRDL